MTAPYDFDAMVYDAELDTYIHRKFADPSKHPSRVPYPDVEPVKRSQES
jgi:hypothetical protein